MLIGVGLVEGFVVCVFVTEVELCCPSLVMTAFVDKEAGSVTVEVSDTVIAGELSDTLALPVLVTLLVLTETEVRKFK